MVDFSYHSYKDLRMGIAYLLKQAVDVTYRDNQLTAALDELCCFDMSDGNMIKVDVNMIKQAFSKPRFSDDIIRYDEIVHDEGDHFLHILKDQDGNITLACSKSGDDSQFSIAEQELSLDPETVYKDAAEGGWSEMKNDLMEFLRCRKTERTKSSKKRVRKKKTSGTNTNSNVTQNNQTVKLIS